MVGEEQHALVEVEEVEQHALEGEAEAEVHTDVVELVVGVVVVDHETFVVVEQSIARLLQKIQQPVVVVGLGVSKEALAAEDDSEVGAAGSLEEAELHEGLEEPY